jgi:tripartite-type tricarboxylate transporter receptor subunit TctC
MVTRRGVLLAAAGLAVGIAGPAFAQAYPNKLIKLVLPYTPGSPNDVIARLIAPALSQRLGQNIIIENRPGGGGSIGTKAVATAEPDGYTLLFASSISHIISGLYASGGYDPLKDFVPVSPLAGNSWVMVVPPSVPANNLKEFIAHAKANPGKLNFGFGQGTAPHLVGEWVKAAAGIDLASIPYKGGAQAITDMLGGRIHMNLGTTATLVPLIRDKKIKGLVVLSRERNPALPDVPTTAESGYPDLAAGNVMGILAPAGTPAAIVATLNREIDSMLNTAEMKAGIAKLGFESQFGAPRQYADFLAGEARKWLPVAASAGIKPN